MSFFNKNIKILSVLGALAFSVQAGFLNPSTFTLDNGLKVVVIEDHRTPVVDILMAVCVGSADENPGKTGVAHFLEHMMFKGVPGESETGFFDKIAAHGGEANAFTSYDSTVYVETIPKEHLDVALALEAKRFQSIKINEDLVERERKVILEELSMRVDGNHNQLAYQTMMSKLLTQHPYRQSIGGYVHEVKTLSVQDILAFHKTWYAPNNVILVLSGDITPVEAKRVVSQHFSSIKPHAVPKRKRLSEPEATDNITQVRLAFYDKRVKQPSLSYQKVLPCFSDDRLKELAAMIFLPRLLCEYNKGFLWKELVEKQKIATNVSLNIDNRKDLAFVELHIDPSPKVTLNQLEVAVEAAVKNAFDRIHEIATPQVVAQIIHQETISNIYAKDNLTGLAHHYAMQLAAGFSLSRLESFIEVIQTVRSADMIKAMQNIFGSQFTLITHIVPQEKKP